MTIGEKIVKLRKQAGYSQEAFGEKLGISRQAVSKWENGTAQPTNENLSQIARLFGVTVSSLLDDEDININQAAEGTVQKEEFTVEKKKNAVTGIFHSGAIIVLALAVIVQGITVGNLRKEIAGLKNDIYRINLAESEIDSLRSYVYSLPSAVTNNSKDFTDYHYEIVSYDFDTDTAQLKFSVVPTDYSRNTQAKIVIKGQTETYNADAAAENGIFTAQTKVKCEDNMTVYLYLTDNGQTRSFVLDCLSNPGDAYRIRLSEDEFDGEITVKNETLKIWGSYDTALDFSAVRNSGITVFPVKAVLQIYADGNLLKELPYDSMMDFDFEQQIQSELEMSTAQVAGSRVYFGMHIDETLKDSRIKDNSQISFVLLVHDTNGREYSRTAVPFK